MDQMAHYAAAGIPTYLVVRMSPVPVESVMEHGVALSYLFKVAAPFEELVE